MKRFAPYFSLLRPVALPFTLAILAGMVAAGASALGLPLMLKKVFPIIFKGKDTEAASKSKEDVQSVLDFVGIDLPEGNDLLLVACLMLPAVFLVRGIAGFVNTYFVNYCGLRVLEAIRIKTYDRLQRLSLNFHHKQSEGDLLSRVLTDTNMMQQVLVKVGCDVIVQPFTLIAAFCFLINESINDSSSFFMLIAMLSIPICVFPIRFLGKKLVKKAQLLQGKLGDMTAIVSENLASQREVRAYNLQDKQVEALQKETTLFMSFQLKVVKYSYMISPAVEIVASFGVAVAIYFGVQKGMTLEKFIPLVTALYFAYEPIKKLGAVHGAIKTGEAALDRIEEVLLSEDEIKEQDGAKKLEEVDGRIEFQNVQFAYDQESVLDSINITVEPGQTVALVGPSGAGKSTFVSLIPRFYDVTNGSVKVDGVDVRELEKHAFRAKIALVSQHPLLFRGTIAENIWLGRPSATLEEVKEAAEKANAHSFIESMPDGYDSFVGERGEGLSGGQRQRVAIARAFLRDAPILILDEATSSLDAESEAQIQQELVELARGRTTFMIAHRFSSIRHAERILVFDNCEAGGGQIIADGSHDELYASCSLYQDLYDHQS